MKKKQYSSSEVVRLLQEVVEQDRCPMDEAMEERILAHICNVARKYRRKRKIKRIALLAVPVLLLAASVPLLCRVLASSQDPGTVATTVQTQTGPDTPASPIQQENTEATPAKHRRIVLGNLESTFELGYSPTPKQSYDAGDNQRRGASLHHACKYTACTDTL